MSTSVKQLYVKSLARVQCVLVRVLGLTFRKALDCSSGPMLYYCYVKRLCFGDHFNLGSLKYIFIPRTKKIKIKCIHSNKERLKRSNSVRSFDTTTVKQRVENSEVENKTLKSIN